MKDNKISIIIPVFNGEKHIVNCLDSILGQAENFEVVVINDGSTDNTLKIVMDKASKFSNLKVFDIENNSGVSNARNIGLRNATGNFIMFCDADDQYSDNTISSVSSVIDNYNPDYIIFNRKDILETKTIALYGKHNSIKVLNVSCDEYIVKYFANGVHTFSVANKVYKKEIIDKNFIKFDTSLALSEDALFNLQYLSNATSFIEDFEISYIRLYRNGSAIYRHINDFYFKNIKIIDMFLRNIVDSNLNKDKLGLIEKELYYHYGKVAAFRLFDNIDGTGFLNRTRSIKEVFNNLKFRGGFSIQKKPVSLRGKVLYNCIKYRLSVISYLIFGTCVRLRQKMKGRGK